MVKNTEHEYSYKGRAKVEINILGTNHSTCLVSKRKKNEGNKHSFIN